MNWRKTRGRVAGKLYPSFCRDLLHPAINIIVTMTNTQTVERAEHSARHAESMEVDE